MSSYLLTLYADGLECSGTCETCSCADDMQRRVYPCPHRFDVAPPEACASYDPDVRACGTVFATMYNHLLLTHSAVQIAALINAQHSEETRP